MNIYYITTENGQKYYYKDGKRITELEGKFLGARKKANSRSPIVKQRFGIKKEYVDCKPHQYRDPITNRCKNKPDYKRPRSGSHRKGSKKRSPTGKKYVDCKPHQFRDPITNRCKNKPDYKRPRSVKTRSRSPKKGSKKRSPTGKKYVDCKAHQYRDPITNRCRNNPDYKRPRSTGSPKKGSSTRARKKEYVDCKPHQYRDPITHRCKNKPGYKKELPSLSSRIRAIQPDTDDFKRWTRVNTIVSDCVTRSKLTLQDLQIKVVEYMEDNDALIVVHGTGCGKTLTAITCTQCYLDKYPDKGVVFVGPASLVSNFKKEMKTYGVKNRKKYDFYSFDGFLNTYKAGNPISFKDKFLVIDEVHNMRNPESAKSIKLVRASFEADKRLLLTATPFVNSMKDFIPLINIVYGKFIVGTAKQGRDQILGKHIDLSNITTFRSLLRNKVDVVECKENPQYYPTRIDHRVDIQMSDSYYKRYSDLVNGEDLFGLKFKNPRKFYHGYRRAVNKTGKDYYSSKIEASIPIFETGKSIIFTNWYDFGITPITEALNKHGVTFDIFSGDIPVINRQSIVNNFNNDKFNVLILTRAGTEGLDLKGVRNVVVLDPTWNDSGLEQLVGRAIRYKSHWHLPKDQQNVNVYFMILTKPDIVDEDDAVESGDRILYNIVKKKKEEWTYLLTLMKTMSI
jgi:superfamily II DNA or RNA helicase